MKDLNQNLEQIKNQKQSSKKEPFSLIIVKTFLAILLFTGMGVIVIGGVYIIGGHYKISHNQPTGNISFEVKGLDHCEKDDDCIAYFSNCYCQYRCINKDARMKDCSKKCPARGAASECVCENNKCVDKTFDTSDWQTYRNDELGLEVKYPEYYFEDRYDLENMTDLDYKRIHFFRDMNNSELDDFKEHYITSFYEEGTHSGTINIKSYNENELKAWYAIDSFNDLKLKEYSNFKVYILEIREVGFYYIIPHNNVDNLYFVFSIPTFLQNNFENNWFSTFKFTNQNTNIADIIKEDEKIEYLKDFEFQNLPDYVFSEQKGATYKLENYIFQFISQPNLNIPLSISSSDIKYKGVLYSKDNGSSWNDLFVIDNPKDYKGNEVKYNPVGMFVKDNKLYLDISDDRGAGSGEGNLLRYSTEDGKIWTRDSCLYLMPELYFNGSDGIEPFVITGNSDCIYSPVSLCTDESFGTAIGSDVYPINPKYKNLHFLGQLFTAADCGPERLSQIWGVDGENYTLGPRIILKNNPSKELIDVFKSIGFDCCDKVSDSKCKQWSHDNYSIKISELLKLEPYHNDFSSDDCANCG